MNIDRKTKAAYELTFWGGINKRYKRFHSTFEAAKDQAQRVLSSLDNRAAHPAIIYGPSLNPDGFTIR